jgi:flagellin-like protein
VLGLVKRPPSGHRADRGQIGVEALIVFIAMIIVAMLSVGVLLDTTGSLRASATSTSEESTGQVVDRVSVFSVYGPAEHSFEKPVDQYAIRSYNVSLTNRTVVLSNTNGESSPPLPTTFVGTSLKAAVDGDGEVILEADGETILVRDGDELALSTEQPDQMSVWNIDTNESLPEGSGNYTNQITIKNDNDGTTETLKLTYEPVRDELPNDDANITTSETETLEATVNRNRIGRFPEGEPIPTDISSGGTVKLKGGAFTDVNDSLIVSDNDILRFYPSNNTIRNVDNDTSAVMRAFTIADDSDGTKEETLTLTYDGETISVTESSRFVILVDEYLTTLKNDMGTARTVSVSSGGNITLSDGDSTLELNDSNDLQVTKPEPGTIQLKNINTGTTLQTDANQLYAVDDGDGITNETLRIGGSPEVREDIPSPLHVEITHRYETTKEDGIYRLTIGMNPGADSIDLADATVTLVGPTNATTLNYVEVGAPMTRKTFVVEPILDEGDTAPVLSEKADRFEILFDAGPVPDGDELIVRITTASGATREFIIEGDGKKQ